MITKTLSEKRDRRYKKLARSLNTYSDCVDNIRILDCIVHRFSNKQLVRKTVFKNTVKINWVERFQKSILPRGWYKIKDDTVIFKRDMRYRYEYPQLLHYIRKRLSSVKPKDYRNSIVMDRKGLGLRTTLYDFKEDSKLKIIMSDYNEFVNKYNNKLYLKKSSFKVTYNYKTNRFTSSNYKYNQIKSKINSSGNLYTTNEVIRKFISMVLEKNRTGLKYKPYYSIEDIYSFRYFNIKYFNMILKYPYISISYSMGEYIIKKYLDNIKSLNFKCKYLPIFKKIYKLDKTDPNYYQKFFKITSIPKSLRTLVCDNIDIYMKYIYLREYFSVDESINKLKSKSIENLLLTDNHFYSVYNFRLFNILSSLVNFKVKKVIIDDLMKSKVNVYSYYEDVIRMMERIHNQIPDYNFKVFNSISKMHDDLIILTVKLRTQNFKFKYDSVVEDAVIDGYEMGRVKESHDLFNISEQLHNCVSGYIDIITCRDKDIYYIKKEGKYIACVSVSCIDKSISQFKFRCNDTIDKHMEYKEIVKKFIKNYKLVNKTEDLKGI